MFAEFRDPPDRRGLSGGRKFSRTSSNRSRPPREIVRTGNVEVEHAVQVAVVAPWYAAFRPRRTITVRRGREYSHHRAPRSLRAAPPPCRTFRERERDACTRPCLGRDRARIRLSAKNKTGPAESWRQLPGQRRAVSGGLRVRSATVASDIGKPKWPNHSVRVIQPGQRQGWPTRAFRLNSSGQRVCF